MKQTVRLVTLTALTLLLVACGGTGTDETAAPANAANRQPPQQTVAVHACSLVTRGEAEAILGPLIANPEEQNSTGKSTCSYVGRKGAAIVMVEYPRAERVETSAEFAAELAADVKENSADPEFAKTFGATRVQPVEGLGVPAAWHDLGPGTGGQVWLDAIKAKERGGFYVRIMTRSFEAAKALAERAVPRLP